MSNKPIRDEDIPPLDVNNPSKRVRFGRDFVAEQQAEDARLDELWTKRTLFAILTILLIVMAYLYFTTGSALPNWW